MFRLTNHAEGALHKHVFGGSTQIYRKYPNLQEVPKFTGSTLIYRKYPNLQEVPKFTGSTLIYRKYPNLHCLYQ